MPPAPASPDTATLRKSARAAEVAGMPDDAIRLAMEAYGADPSVRETKQLIARLLRHGRIAVPVALEATLHALLLDPDMNPRRIERAGWHLLIAAGRLPDLASDAEHIAQWLEGDAFARDLLHQSFVTLSQVETVLTRLRRWLLLSARAPEFPLATAALIRQAALNGGAWSFDAGERARIAVPGEVLAPAYLPPRPRPADEGDFASPLTRIVARQYEGWPYPGWLRPMRAPILSFRDTVAARGPDAPQDMPEDAAVLVAGCGTGQEPIQLALRHPHLRITAIDISRTALDYAIARAAEAGVRNIRFERLDLHCAADLGEPFDHIVSSGVLHHLPDPEAGWAAIAGVLRPGGTMRLMLYSRVARMPVQAVRARIRDLTEREVDDDLIREVRARLQRIPVNTVTASADFFHLGGVHDLLLHRHEDPFDVPRIRRAIDALGLRLLGFALPQPRQRALYLARNPHDPHFRDHEAWAALERRQPTIFAGMYDFWCHKPGP